MDSTMKGFLCGFSQAQVGAALLLFLREGRKVPHPSYSLPCTRFSTPFKRFVYFYVYGYFACMSVYACGGQKRASDPWELELQMVVTYLVGTGN